MIGGLMADLMIVNPARAGMIRFLYPAARRISGKPRASGDDPMSVSSSIDIIA